MTTFPLTMDKHIAFCVIGFIFFIIQFFRQHYKYQLISAFAIAGTLLLYISDSHKWRYGVGILELVLIIAIFVVMSVEKKKAEQKELAAKKANEPAAGAEQLQTAGDKGNE